MSNRQSALYRIVSNLMAIQIVTSGEWLVEALAHLRRVQVLLRGVTLQPVCLFHVHDSYLGSGKVVIRV